MALRPGGFPRLPVAWLSRLVEVDMTRPPTYLIFAVCTLALPAAARAADGTCTERYWNHLQAQRLQVTAKSEPREIAKACQRYLRELRKLPVDNVDAEALQCGQSARGVVSRLARLSRSVQAHREASKDPQTSFFEAMARALVRDTPLPTRSGVGAEKAIDRQLVALESACRYEDRVGESSARLRESYGTAFRRKPGPRGRCRRS